jgi:hypothetical protein
VCTVTGLTDYRKAGMPGTFREWLWDQIFVASQNGDLKLNGSPGPPVVDKAKKPFDSVARQLTDGQPVFLPHEVSHLRTYLDVSVKRLAKQLKTRIISVWNGYVPNFPGPTTISTKHLRPPSLTWAW